MDAIITDISICMRTASVLLLLWPARGLCNETSPLGGVSQNCCPDIKVALQMEAFAPLKMCSSRSECVVLGYVDRGQQLLLGNSSLGPAFTQQREK
jgi:hypothetical protein